MAESIRQQLKTVGEAYEKNCDEYRAKGIVCVPWTIVKTARQYLYNKNVDRCVMNEIIIEDHYQVISITVYEGNTYIGTVILQPDDTEGKAYGKVDRYILDVLKSLKGGK